MKTRQHIVLHYCAAYAVVLGLSALVLFRFHTSPPPRYGDLYLPPVALICARYSWKSAAALFAVAYLTLLWPLLPLPADRIFGYAMFGITGAMMNIQKLLG